MSTNNNINSNISKLTKMTLGCYTILNILLLIGYISAMLRIKENNINEASNINNINRYYTKLL